MIFIIVSIGCHVYIIDLDYISCDLFTIQRDYTGVEQNSDNDCSRCLNRTNCVCAVQFNLAKQLEVKYDVSHVKRVDTKCIYAMV